VLERAPLKRGNFGQADVGQHPTVGGTQVEVVARASVFTRRGPEQSVRVRADGADPVCDIGPDRVTVRADARPEREQKVGRDEVEATTHGKRQLPGEAGDCPMPSAVCDTDTAQVPGPEEDRQTVGNLDAEADSDLAGIQCISGRRFVRQTVAAD
jgi:hypothetical protein